MLKISGKHEKMADGSIILFATEEHIDRKKPDIILYKTGVSVEFPAGQMGLLIPHTHLVQSSTLIFGTAIQYTTGGEISLMVRCYKMPGIKLKLGDPIAQLIVVSNLMSKTV